MLLQKQHADLRAYLAKRAGQALPADMSERIESMRLTLNQTLKDSIHVYRTLSQRIYVLNLGGYADALRANLRLGAVCNDVAQTLRELDKKEASK